MQRTPTPCYSAAISSLIFAMASARLSPLGHVQEPRGDIRTKMQTRTKKPRRTVENSMTSIQTHLVLQLFLPLCTMHIPRISNPAVSLHKGGRPEIYILIPPVRRAQCQTTCAKDTFIHAVKFLSVFGRLKEFCA
jgi:hypothetical protein